MTDLSYWGRRRVARRRFLHGAAITSVGSAAILAGCGGDDDDDATATQPGGQTAQPGATSTPDPATPKQGGTLRLPIIFSSGAFDIHQFVIGYQVSLWRAVANGLFVSHPETGQATGDLAEEWSFEDETTLVIKLKPGVKWQNIEPVSGRDLTAEDVKFSFERLATPSADFPRNSDYAQVDSIDAVDASTVRFNLKAPYSPLINLMTNGQACVVAPEVVSQFGDLTDPRAMIGTGAFIAERVDGSSGARLVRNPDYFESPLPYLEAVEWTIVNDTQTSLAAFRAGDFDMHDIAAIDLPSFQNDSNVNIVHYPSPTYMVAGVGGPIDEAPLSDPRVRQAMDLALDRRQLGNVVYPGGSFELSSVFGHPYWSLPNDEIVQRPGFREDKEADLAEARALISSIGSAVELTISTTNQFPSFHIDRAQVYKDNFEKAGMTINIETDEYSAYKEKERNKRFELSTLALGFAGDPDAPLSAAFLPDGARNYFSYEDQDYANMISQSRAIFEDEARRDLLWDAQRKLLEDRPVAAFNAWFLFADIGLRNYVRGARFGGTSPSGSNSGDQGAQLRHIWLDV